MNLRGKRNKLEQLLERSEPRALRDGCGLQSSAMHLIFTGGDTTRGQIEGDWIVCCRSLHWVVPHHLLLCSLIR